MLHLILLQVDLATASEKQRLENQKQEAIDAMQSKHKYELDNQKDDMERRHRDKVESMRRDLTDKHEDVSLIYMYHISIVQSVFSTTSVI